MRRAQLSQSQSSGRCCSNLPVPESRSSGAIRSKRVANTMGQPDLRGLKGSTQRRLELLVQAQLLKRQE